MLSSPSSCKLYADLRGSFTVTNQVINTFLEAGLPFIMRAVADLRGGRGLNGKKKHVTIDPSASVDGTTAGEQELLEDVRRQVSLPPYSIFSAFPSSLVRLSR